MRRGPYRALKLVHHPAPREPAQIAGVNGRRRVFRQHGRGRLEIETVVNGRLDRVNAAFRRAVAAALESAALFFTRICRALISLADLP